MATNPAHKRASRKTQDNPLQLVKPQRVVDFVPLDEAEQFAAEQPTEFLECRVGLGHKWEHHGGKRNPDGSITRTVICERCGNEKPVKFTPTGKRRRGGSPKYPDGYLRNGGGRFNTEGNDALRAELMNRWITN